MPGLGVRIGVPPHITPFVDEGGLPSGTAPVELIVSDPERLDQTRLPMPIIGSNIVCRIFGMNNTNNPLAIQVKWDGKVMDQAIFYGEPIKGAPFAGIWTLFNQTPSEDGKLEIFCGRDRAGAAAIRAGSLGDVPPTLVSTDYEADTSMHFPITNGNLMLVVGGCLDSSGHPIASDKLEPQWSALIDPHVNNPTGGAAYFGGTRTKSADDNYSLIANQPFPGIMVAAEWAITGARNAAQEG